MSTTRPLGAGKVNAIGLGCMNVSHAYGPPLPEAEAGALLQQALDIGYDFFDTATLYGGGENEKLIGKAIGHRRDEFFLASKCVLGFVNGKRGLDGRPEVIRQHCEDSLQRLGMEHIDLYYMHRLDRKVPVEESVGALADLVREGKIGNIGLSEMSADTIRRAHAVHPIAAVQSEYSLWTRNPELGVLQTCAELGIAFVAFSPVARGFLGDDPLQPEAFHEHDLRRGMPRFAADNFSRNMNLHRQTAELATELGCGVPQLALAWVLAQGEHVLAIPGTTSAAHLQQNFDALQVTLPEAALQRLDALFEPRAVAGNRYSDAAQKTVDTECFEFEVYEN